MSGPDQSQRLLPACTSDEGQDGLLTVLWVRHMSGHQHYSQTLLWKRRRLTLAYWSNSTAASACRRCSVSFPVGQTIRERFDRQVPVSPARQPFPWIPARSLASRARCSGGRGICWATHTAFLQLEQLTNACRALVNSPHRHSNRPACSA